MAQFTNQAQLSYNNVTVNSNVTVGELLETLTATKTAVGSTYAQDGEVTYVISLLNSGNTPIAEVSVRDDLGAYPFGESTLTPLSYVAGSVLLYTNGVLAAPPTVTEQPILTFSDISIPASGSVVLVYKASVNGYAPLDATSSIVNTATVTGDGILEPIVATETVTPVAEPQLTITKSLEPTTVTDNSPLTYRFFIQNYGNTAVVATDNASVTDTFEPKLTNITVTLDGTPLTLGTDYTYDESTGVFTTVPGRIVVPAATFTQDPITGLRSVIPGTTTLIVTGIV